MNKRSLRAFSFGIIFSVGVIGAYYYGYDQKSEKLDQKEAIKLLESNQYVVVKKEKYEQLVNEKKHPTKEKIKREKTKEKASKITNNVFTYKLEIKRGMTSHQIAEILEKQGIIDSGENFSQYLSAGRFSRKLQLGVFSLTSDMSYNQIAKIITTKS